MKRKEILKIIAEHIYQLNVEPDECMTIANDILQDIENAGMVPNDYIRHNEWEPESE